MRNCGPLVIALTLASVITPRPAQAQNLIGNGGFESGSAGWDGGQVVTDGPHAGGACLAVVDNSSTTSVDSRTRALLPVMRGQSYRLDVWIRGAAAGQQAMVTLEQYDTAGKWISGNNYDFVASAGTEWTLFSRLVRAFTPSTGFVRLVLRPVLWTDAGELKGTAWFDDAFFGPVAEAFVQYATWIRNQGPVRVWHSPTEHKVRRDTYPSAEAPMEEAVTLEAARGESEPAQIVLLPDRDDQLTAASVSELSGPAGAVIPAAAVTVREVGYVQIIYPTDSASFTGWMPDPLPLLGTPLSLAAGVQQPLWLTVRVPAEAVAGDYSGTLRLTFGTAAPVGIPLALRVWDFALTQEHHLRTAYGMSLDQIDRYHHLNSDSSLRRQVFQLYLQDFAAHRISPYDILGDDQIEISFPDANWPLASVVTDPEHPAGGNHVLEVRDDRTDAAIGIQSSRAIPVLKGTRYSLGWKARTETRRDYAVAVNQYKVNGDWISGHNIDTVRAGTGSWTQDSVVITAAQLTAETAFVRITLFACPWTLAGELTGTTWFDDISFSAEGSSFNLVSNPAFELKPDQVDLAADFTHADPAFSYALDTLGIDSFRLPLPFFAWGDTTGHHGGSILGYSWDTPEFENIYGKLLRTVDDHLAQRGWLDRAYTYWYDEPGLAEYPFVIQGMDLIHRSDPRLKRLLTEQFSPDLAGRVDIWTPIFDMFDASWAGLRQALGEQVWWYVCTGPKAPYPNNFIDHPGIEHRIRFWMAWKYGVQGDLYWDTTYWTNDDVFPPPHLQDPWNDPMSYNYSGSVGMWGNGDGRLLYPPRSWSDGQTRVEGPTPSIRWELIREGIEDYEYLWMLRDAADRLDAIGGEKDLVSGARELLSLPEPLFSSLTSYTDDPTLLQSHRRQVARMLERILPVVKSAVGLSFPGSAAGVVLTSGSTGPVQTGYAAATVTSGTVPYGVAVFSFKQGGVVVSEAAVPASPPTTAARVFIDYRAGVAATPGRAGEGLIDIDTGVAVVNRGSRAATVTYTLRNAAGTGITAGHGQIAAGAHFAKFINQFEDVAPDFSMPDNFSTATQFGSLDIASDQPISVIALRLTRNQRNEALLTTTPIADLTGASGDAPVYFPQFVDGGGYLTTLIFLNTSNEVETGKLALSDDSGAAMSVNQVGGTRNSTFDYAIQPGGVFVFQTDGFPVDARVGWARLIPDSNTSSPVGAGVFSYSQGAVRVTESGIPAAIPTTNARIYVDQSGYHATGLAIANPGVAGLDVKLKAYHADGKAVAEGGEVPLSLDAVGHTARFVSQLLPALPAGFEGILDISSTSPFVALTLRSLTNSRGDFLLTTFPVADQTRPAPAPMIFPQIADGGGYATEFVLMTAGGPSSLILRFYAEDGTPLPLGK
jgi:hypothetical protein